MNIATRVNHLEKRAGVGLPRLPVEAIEPVSLESPSDVLAVLEEQVNAVRSDSSADPIDKARTLGFLSAMALRVMEGRDLAARLEAVERVLKLRRDEQRADKKGRRG